MGTFVNFLISALLITGPAAPKNPDPIKRDWAIIAVDQQSSIIYGIDPTSFKVLKPGDEFSFDLALFAGEGTELRRGNQGAVLASVATVRVSCSLRHAQIIDDTDYGLNGIIARGDASRHDKMGPASPASIIGIILSKICSGQQLLPPKDSPSDVKRPTA